MSTVSAPRVVIVVPCYNEAKRLDVRGFRECAAAMPHVRFLFVNDGSTDDTAAVLTDLCIAAPRSFARLDLPTNMGKAEAVRAGMLAASEACPEQVGFWDADLATPLGALPAFCALLEERREIDLVIGSRVRLLGRRIERRTVRHYAGRVFATAASIVLGIAVYDTQCGAKLFRFSEHVRRVFGAPFHSRWIFDVEILARLICARRAAGLVPLGNAVYELPLSEWRDVKGSKVKWKDFAGAGLDLLGIYWRYSLAPVPVPPRAVAPRAVAPQAVSVAPQAVSVAPQPVALQSEVRTAVPLHADAEGSVAPTLGDRSSATVVLR